MPNRKLAAFTIIALIAIEIATVASHWRDVKARRPDFASLYSSAKLMREGKPTAAEHQVETQSETPAATEANQSSGMRADTLHPPFETALFVPLTFFSYKTAYMFWLGCNLVMLWAVPLLLWNELGSLQREFHFIAIIYGSMYPVLVCLVQGQDAILLLLLLTLSYRAMVSNRETLSGILLALCLFKFQITVPIALLLIAARKWRVIAGFASAAGVLTLASILLIGLRNALGYARFIAQMGMQSAAAGTDDPALMPNLRGLIVSTIGKEFSPGVITAMVIGLSIVILVFAARWAFTSRSVEWALRFSSFVLVSCVISYHFFPHNACVLMLPILLAANAFVDEGVPGISRWMFAGSVLAIYLGPNLLPLAVAMPVVAFAALLLPVLVFARPTRQAAGAQ